MSFPLSVVVRSTQCDTILRRLRLQVLLQMLRDLVCRPCLQTDSIHTVRPFHLQDRIGAANVLNLESRKVISVLPDEGRHLRVPS